MAKAIAPDEIYENKETYIHSDILEIVNQLLGERYSKGSQVNIQQREIAVEFMEKNPEYTEQRMLNEGLFDFEDAYRKKGWNVEYNKPVFDGGECYFNPYYKFTSTK